MGSPWKALSDDNRRRIMLLLKEKEIITPTEIAEHFKFTMPGVSINLRILKEADLIIERKEGKNRLYSLNSNNMRLLLSSESAPRRTHRDYLHLFILIKLYKCLNKFVRQN